MPCLSNTSQNDGDQKRRANKSHEPAKQASLFLLSDVSLWDHF